VCVCTSDETTKTAEYNVNSTSLYIINIMAARNTYNLNHLSVT